MYINKKKNPYVYVSTSPRNTFHPLEMPGVYTSLLKREALSPQVTDEEAEAQRDAVTCLKSHSNMGQILGSIPDI